MATNDVKSAQDAAQQPVAELSGRLMKMLEELQKRSPMDILKNLVGMLMKNVQTPQNQPKESATPNNPANQQTQNAVTDNKSNLNQQSQKMNAAIQTTAQASPSKPQTIQPKPEKNAALEKKAEAKPRKAKTETKKDKSRGSDAAWDSQMKLLNATIALSAKVDKLKQQHDTKQEAKKTQSQQHAQKPQHSSPSPGRK